jgi:hypothetical protein
MWRVCPPARQDINARRLPRIYILVRPTDPAIPAAVTPDGKRAVSVLHDKTLKVWDLERGRQVVSFFCDSTPWYCAAARNDRIVAGDFNGRMYFLRLMEQC